MAPLSTAAAALAIPVLRVSWKWQATVIPWVRDALYEIPHLVWYSHADGVGKDDLVGTRRRNAGGDPEYVLGVDLSFERVSEGGGERDGDAYSV